MYITLSTIAIYTFWKALQRYGEGKTAEEQWAILGGGEAAEIDREILHQENSLYDFL